MPTFPFQHVNPQISASSNCFWFFSPLMIDRELFGARATLINSFIQRSQVSYLAVSCLADTPTNKPQAILYETAARIGGEEK
jgi:hypothetical protein